MIYEDPGILRHFGFMDTAREMDMAKTTRTGSSNLSRAEKHRLRVAPAAVVVVPADDEPETEALDHLGMKRKAPAKPAAKRSTKRSTKAKK